MKLSRQTGKRQLRQSLFPAKAEQTAYYMEVYVSKLYFSYAAMNAGKSTILLQASHNYRERGMQTLVLTAKLDTREAEGMVSSRIGLSTQASTFAASTNIYDLVKKELDKAALHCVLVDEAQFLSEPQVWELAKVSDELCIPVLCYGLRTDFQGKLFPGSAALLAIADTLREIRTICWCGRKATMVLRLDEAGMPVFDGDQVQIGGNTSYVSLCRTHWKKQQFDGS